MVKLHSPTTIVVNGQIQPAMPRHTLEVIKSAPGFELGETVECFISRYDNDRYAVWDSTWKTCNKYHVFNSKKELEKHFNEKL